MKLVGGGHSSAHNGGGTEEGHGRGWRGGQGQRASGPVTCTEPLEGWALWGTRGLCRCDAWGMGRALQVMGVSGAEAPPLGPWAAPGGPSGPWVGGACCLLATQQSRESPGGHVTTGTEVTCGVFKDLGHTRGPWGNAPGQAVVHTEELRPTSAGRSEGSSEGQRPSSRRGGSSASRLPFSRVTDTHKSSFPCAPQPGGQCLCFIASPGGHVFSPEPGIKSPRKTRDPRRAGRGGVPDAHRLPTCSLPGL